MTAVIRVEFPPALMGRDLAAYYIGKSVRELDKLRELREITPVGDGKQVEYKKSDLDKWIERRPERPATRAQR